MSVRSRVLTVLVLAIAAAAMIASNSHFTILDDESTIVTVAGHPVLPTMELFLLGGDQHEHPPLSDVALHLWLIATNYSFSMLRVFANLFYLAGAVVLALAARKAAGMSAYWACLLLALLWPFSFQYGRITGWYAVSWFLIALLTWIYLKILDSGGSGAWTAFGMVSVLFVWTNYFSAAILLLLLADLVLFHRELARKRIRSFTVVIGVVALSFLPLLRMAALEVTANVTSMASHPTLKSAIATLGYPLFSAFASTAVAPWYLPLSIPAFLAAAVLLVSAWGGAGRRWLVYWALAMILLGLSVHLDVKRVLFLLPWLLLAMALAIAGGGERWAKPAFASCVALVLVGWAGIISGRHYSTTNLYEPWQKVADTVAADARSGATILSDNSPFFFYLNYRLGLEKESQTATDAYLGQHVYRSHGYNVFFTQDLSQWPNPHGKVVLVIGSAPIELVQNIEAADEQLRSRCAVVGEYRAAPDPSLALKEKYAGSVPALAFRTDVIWFNCP